MKGQHREETDNLGNVCGSPVSESQAKYLPSVGMRH